MNAKIIALPAAAGLALGGASLATGAPDPPERPTLVQPAPTVALAGDAPLMLPDPHPFGLHDDIAEAMAKELNLPADRVVAAMRAAIGAQFDRRRDEALECFDDREKCRAVAALPPFPPFHAGRPIPVRPGRTIKP